MANNGIYYSSGNTLNFTTNDTTWATLTSGGTFVINTVSGGTYLNLPASSGTSTSGDYLPLSGGTVTGNTYFTSGLTASTLTVTGNTILANTSGTSFYTNYIDFNLTATTSSSVGRLKYDNGEGGLVTTMFGGNVDLKVGQENVVFCYNGDSVILTKGQIVSVDGNQGNRPKIVRSVASAETTSSTALGVVSETIGIGSEGFVTTFGPVRGFQLTGITPGSYVYLSPNILGGFTGTQPQAPQHIVAIGYVVRTGNTQGEIFVNINNGWEINELHNVRITNATNNDILQLSAGTPDIWINVSEPTLNGLSVTGNTSLQGLTATTISATTYQNLPFSGTVTGNGTSNYLPKWTGTTALGDSLVYDSTTGITIGTGFTWDNTNSRLGIGIGTPTKRLEVYDSGSGDGLSVVRSSVTTQRVELIPNDSTASVLIKGGGNSKPFYIASWANGGTAQPLYFGTNYSNGINEVRMSIDTTGNVGIGTITASTKLDVRGTTRLSATTGTSLTVISSGNSTSAPVFSVQGSQGELFSVTDSLTGSLFSVSDISGLPILEVFSDSTTVIGDYQAPSLYTTKRMTITASTGTTIYSIPTSAYTSSFIDYNVSGSTGLRAGNIMAIWSGTSVNFTETSTNDLGNTTPLTFGFVISGSSAVLQASASTSTWIVKTIVRGL